MPARARLALMVAALLVLLGAVGVVWLHDPAPKADGNTFQGAQSPEDIPPADFRLRDEDGKVVRVSDLRGRPVVLTFLYSTCQDTCPLTAQQVRIALDQLGHDVPVLAVSVDPPRDTPANAKRFLTKQHVTGRLRFLLGTRAELEPIWKRFGIRPQGQGFDHTAHVFLLDAKGRQRVGWPVDQLRPEGLAQDLRLLEGPRAEA